MQPSVDPKSEKKLNLGYLIKNRRAFLIAAAAALAICLLPTPEGLSIKGQYALGLMAFVVICFFTEAIPLPAVALTIGSYQVLTGITSFDKVTQTFMGDAVAFIMGALMIGAVLVKHGIHNRIALLILKVSGTNVTRVSLGIVTFCALCAGFVSEHATATIMLPVGMGIVGLSGGFEKVPRLAKMLMLCICYGCVIGGLASPSGGARNALMIGFLRQFDITIGYAQWILMAMPFTIIMIPIVVLWLNKCFKPEVKDLGEAVEKIKEDLAKEGSLSTQGKMSLGLFIVVLFLWITASDTIGLGNIAVMGAIAALILNLVDWDFIERQTQWGVVILYAGAISMGSMLEKTGAALWLAKKLLAGAAFFGIHKGLPLVAATSFITSLSTNMMADGPTVAVLGPILLKTAEISGTSPVIIGIATSLSAAFAYLLIIGTPANAIVYGPGYLTALDYLKAGSVLFLISLVILIFGIVGFYWNILGIW
ncbi:MAG: DASS family sodium-coupled anion symporter [Clostridiales bacterium]|nr:DASS family sodium-coupled anion symporter [Clostridiales bacterium]MCF8023461.1 DASS family sodium-coupled anion symporter [Clostridiales bacterium]